MSAITGWSALRRIAAAESGFTIIEVMVAVMVMSIGVVALLSSFDSSRTLATKSEMQDTANAVAQKEIARIEAQPWAAVALRATPTAQSSNPADPTSYISTGTCAAGANLPSHSPCYQWDWSNSSNVEPLVIDSTNGDSTACPGQSPTWSNPCPWHETVSTTNGNVRLQGNLYRYITYVYDPSCIAAACGGTSDPRRITVAVTVNGLPKPVVMSTVYTNPLGSSEDPLSMNGVTCVDIGGGTVPCTH